jgi:ABC-type sugar transport system ATPase subunit
VLSTISILEIGSGKTQPEAKVELKRVPLLEAVNISKNFGSVRALDGVNFSVHHQEIVGLLGDNGAGKSTLVKVISGVHPPDGGEIFMEGVKTKLSSPALARRMGIETIYQDLALVDDLSIYRNMFLAREIKKRYLGLFNFLDDKRMQKEALNGLDSLKIGISTVRDPVRYLSGGQRQSVSTARAILTDAKLFLMDEPTAALGVAESRQVLKIIRELKDKGRSVVVIAHNIRHIMSICDRLVILRRGKLVGDMPAKGLTVDDVEEVIIGS